MDDTQSSRDVIGLSGGKGFPFTATFHNVISECPAHELMTPKRRFNGRRSRPC